jgi:isoleucyl-tRNA synthetase
MVLEEKPCMRAIMTHGFTVDAKGQKMSKSLGNVIAPQEIIEQLGTDGLRLWVASIGNDGDAVVSDVLLRNVGEVYRKIRNTARFLLQNLYDYDHTKDAVALKTLTPIDQYALTQLALLNSDLIKRYHAGDFTAVFHELADYCAGELSAFYLDIIKDRLYVEKADGHARRSAQTVIWYILDALTKLMAPILSFTAEQLSDFYQKDKTASIHLQDFAVIPLIETSDAQVSLTEETWGVLKSIRSAVLKSIEPEREKGLIKHSLEAAITLYFAPTMRLYDEIKKFDARFFKEFFIVSQVHLVDLAEGLFESAIPGLFVKTEVAQGTKCPRCWNWEVTSQADGLCARCQLIVEKQSM